MAPLMDAQSGQPKVSYHLQSPQECDGAIENYVACVAVSLICLRISPQWRQAVMNLLTHVAFWSRLAQFAHQGRRALSMDLTTWNASAPRANEKKAV